MYNYLHKLLILILSLFTTSTTINAASYITRDGIRYVYNSDKTEVSVTSLKSPDVYIGDIIIPESIVNSSNEVIPVVAVGSSAFNDCIDLTSVSLPSTVTKIGDYAFDGCEGLKSVVMDGVETIGHWAFRNCYALENLTFGNNLTTIGNYCFDKNYKIVEITIPASTTLIGGFAFEGNPQLTKVTCMSVNPPEIKKGYLDGEEIYTIFDDTDYSGKTLYVPLGATDNYKSKLGWNYFPEIKEFDPSGISVAKRALTAICAQGGNSIAVTSAANINIQVVNLNGQVLRNIKTSEGTTIINDLPKGIVLVNGIKVLVK
ncbi:MAG: leucine-rich repeat domain-containing protein [Muribaculaceae bacterium]